MSLTSLRPAQPSPTLYSLANSSGDVYSSTEPSPVHRNSQAQPTQSQLSHAHPRQAQYRHIQVERTRKMSGPPQSSPARTNPAKSSVTETSLGESSQIDHCRAYPSKTESSLAVSSAGQPSPNKLTKSIRQQPCPAPPSLSILDEPSIFKPKHEPNLFKAL